MSKLKELREARQVAANTIYQLRDKVTAGEGREFTSEERSAWDKANKDFNDLGRQFEVTERGDAVAAALSERRGEVPGTEDTGGHRREKRTKDQGEQGVRPDRRGRGTARPRPPGVDSPRSGRGPGREALAGLQGDRPAPERPLHRPCPAAADG